MRFLDLRAAIRSLARSPGFLTAAVLSLSIAIGASAAAFSVVDAVRFRTLPFPEGDRLVVLSERLESREAASCRSACDVSYETYANRLRPAPPRSLNAVAASALGARGGRIIREQFAQQLILVGAAAVLGVMVAGWLLGILQSVDVLQSVRPSGMEYRIDWRSIGFTAGLALLIGAMLSLVPSRVAARTEVQSILREGGPGAAGGRRGLPVQQAFVVAQIAIAVILVTGAGLMARTVIRLSQVELGFEPASLVDASPSLPHSWRVRSGSFRLPATSRISSPCFPGRREWPSGR